MIRTRRPLGRWDRVMTPSDLGVGEPPAPVVVTRMTEEDYMRMEQETARQQPHRAAVLAAIEAGDASGAIAERLGVSTAYVGALRRYAGRTAPPRTEAALPGAAEPVDTAAEEATEWSADNTGPADDAARVNAPGLLATRLADYPLDCDGCGTAARIGDLLVIEWGPRASPQTAISAAMRGPAVPGDANGHQVVLCPGCRQRIVDA